LNHLLHCNKLEKKRYYSTHRINELRFVTESPSNPNVNLLNEGRPGGARTLDLEIGTYPLHNTPTSTRMGGRRTLSTLSTANNMKKLNRHYETSQSLPKKSLTASSKLNYEVNNSNIAKSNTANYNNRKKASALKKNVKS
jgi:hypothetical protein